MTEELSVPLCGPEGTINLDQVRVMAQGLQEPAHLGPPPGGAARLVLDNNPVSHLEGGKLLGALYQGLLSPDVPLGMGQFPLFR